jgi:hypothetical protein
MQMSRGGALATWAGGLNQACMHSVGFAGAAAQRMPSNRFTAAAAPSGPGGPCRPAYAPRRSTHQALATL